MEPNEWQKKKNNKTTENTQKITSQARIAEEKLWLNRYIGDLLIYSTLIMSI